VQALRPKALDGATLPKALEDATRHLSADAVTSFTFEQRGRYIELPIEAQAELFRIAQEAMTNVRKHARATSSWIILESRKDHLVLTVRDNGIGLVAEIPLDTTWLWHGDGMRERAQRIGGRLEVVSPANLGTTIRVRIPVSGGRYA